jgi:predicted negative regulator of RcsB-dependent stress response
VESEYNSYEQAERAREWVKSNIGAIIVGVLLALAALFGFNRYQRAQDVKHEIAASKFDAYIKTVEAKNLDEAAKLATQAQVEKSAPIYTSLIALYGSKQALDAGKTADSEKALREAVTSAPSKALRGIASIRLARVLVGAGKPAEAESALANVDEKLFEVELAKVRGDIALAKGKRDDAKVQFEKALAKLDSGAPDRVELQQKLDDLTTAGGA